MVAAETEKPKDRDFIETEEGLLFCVVGYLHPPDRYTAYLKYSPAPDGKWSRGRTRYSRAISYYHVTQVENTYKFLREQYPKYLFRCPIRNITISSVPKKNVATYFLPKQRLQYIMTEGATDKLEQKLIKLVTFLSDHLDIRVRDFGVTGSILTRSHNPRFSDIDLTIYGHDASWMLKRSLNEKREKSKTVQIFNHEKNMEWSIKRSKRFPLSFDELKVLAERRWNYGEFQGTYFSIHPIRADDEINEKYGDHIYSRLGTVTGTAYVKDCSESIYLPAIYNVEDVKTDADIKNEIEQVVSYEGLFSGVFYDSERIEFKGSLEEVSNSQSYLRIVIGGANSKDDYLKPLV